MGLLPEYSDYLYAGYNLPIIKESQLQYYPLPTDSFMVVPSEQSFYMQRPIPLNRRTSTFRVIHQRNCTLVGYRSYLTQDGDFFTDESLNKEYSLASYAKGFQGGRKIEEYYTDFHENAVRIKNEPPKFIIDEPVICLGSAECSNYGSWLYRLIRKMIQCMEHRDRLILTYENSQWMKDVLRFFLGSDIRTRPHWPHERYLLRDVLIPTARNIDVFFDAESLDFYRTAAAAVPGRSTDEKIYLSRRGQKLRSLENEQELIQRLQELGFAIISPEKLSFEEQIRTIRDAKVIVCPGGSGLFNSVFAANARYVVDIEPGWDWIYAHHNLLRSCRLPHTVLLGERLEASNPHSAWTVDVEAVTAALRA